MTDTQTAEAAPDSGTNELADSILGIAADTDDTKPEAKEEPTKADTKRDEKGRFAKTEAEKKAEEKAEGKPEAKAEAPEKKVDTVPHAALHEERERRKELQRQLQEQADRTAKMEERFSQFIKVAAPPAPAEEPDPLTRIDNLENKLSQTLSAADQERKQQHEEQQFVNRYRASAEAFLKDRPDFAEAYQYLLNDRKSELELIGLSPTEVTKELIANERTIAENAYRAERNPAQVLYEMAKKRGYGASASAAPAPKAEDKIEQLDKGLKAAKSLGSGGSKPDSGAVWEGLSLADIANMDDKEWSEVWKAYEKTATRR